MKRLLTILLLHIFFFTVCADQTEQKIQLLSLLSQTNMYLTIEDYEQAAELRDQALVLFKELGKDNDLSTISELHKVSHAYSEKGMYDDAITTESLLVEVFPMAEPNNVKEYALFLNDLAFYQLKNDNLILAENTIKKALSLIKNDDDIDLMGIYISAAEIYQKTSPARTDLSIKYQKKAVDSFAINYGKTDTTYLAELLYLANYFEKGEDYENALNAYLEFMQTRANDDNENDLNTFLPILDRIIFCSRKAKNSEVEEWCKAIAFGITAIRQGYHEAKYKSARFPSIQDSLEYRTISEKLDLYREQKAQWLECGDKTKAQQIEEEKKRYLLTLPDSYGKAYILSIESMRNSLLHNNKESFDFGMLYNSSLILEYGLEALRIYDNIGITTDLYVVTLCTVAMAYDDLDNPAKAYDYILRAYELRDDYLSSDNIFYNGMLSDLASYCCKLGNYQDALTYGSLAVDAEEPSLYTDNPYGYFRALNNLATYCGAAGLEDKELEIMLHLVEKAEEIELFFFDWPENPYLFNLASSYLSNGDYEKAIETGLKVKERREKLGMKALISNIDDLLAKAYRLNGQMEEALFCAKQANKNQKEIGGDDNMSLSKTYDTLAWIYKDMGKNDEAEKMERSSINITYNHIVHNFVDLSSIERTSFWNKYSHWFDIYYPNFFYHAEGNDATELFNKSALFAKGILLNADIEMSKLIIESGDDISLAKYQKLLINKSILSKMASSKDHLIQITADSLRIENDKLERELIKECKVFGDYSASMRTTWEDVQNALGIKDIALEFISFPLIDESNNNHLKTLYAALSLKKDDKTPQFTVLFDDSELDRIEHDNLYEKKLYELVWVPLLKHLSGVSNIYFSPSGFLHQIPIESLALEDGSLMSEHYNLYRLSSTRQLVTGHINMNMTTAIVYGGLDYDATSDELVLANKGISSLSHGFDSKLTEAVHGGLDYDAISYELVSANKGISTSPSHGFDSKLIAMRSLEESSLRAGCGPLEGSRREAEFIAEALQENKKIKPRVYVDSQGTEESFKALSGQCPSLLHIGTHGFYWTPDEAEQRKQWSDNLRFLGESSQRVPVEDKALSRSGLMMAGCNRVFNNDILPDSLDDGILTAKEISQMDLRGLDLVVLSACETALGDISGSEGVFGLQRAFKKAGAQAIMMSLWKVDDLVAESMMKFFYTHLTQGESIRQSFSAAQQELRAIDPDPRHWAAFILMDALD